MDEEIIVKYVRIDGQMFEKPLPKFEYNIRTGHWTILVEAVEHTDFFASRQDQEVEIEVGMQLGTLRDVGVVKMWTGQMPNAPSFIAKIVGGEPMGYVEG